jgi:DNA-binding beta-propeller fold protein YncE
VALGLRPAGDELYVTGPQLEDFATIALDADTGSQRWSVRYGTLSVADEPVSIAVSPDGGRIYVTGTGRKAPGSEGSTNIDWIETVAYGVG